MSIPRIKLFIIKNGACCVVIALTLKYTFSNVKIWDLCYIKKVLLFKLGPIGVKSSNR